MRAPGNGETLHRILLPGCMAGIVVLTVFLAGCASAPQAAPSPTPLPPTIDTPEPAPVPASDLPDPITGDWAFVSTDGEPVTLSFSADGLFSETVNGSLLTPGSWNQTTPGEYAVLLSTNETRNYHLDMDNGTLTDTALPETIILPVETPEPAPVPASGLPDPVIGSWAFVNADGVAAGLTFSADGQFSGTIEESPSLSGTWSQAAPGDYTVSLSSGESRMYHYDAPSDTLYNTASPDIFITRQ